MRSEKRILRDLIAITLTCGHQVTARNSPLHNKSTYVCTAGKGCGYTLPWVSYRSYASELTHENPLHQSTEGKSE